MPRASVLRRVRLIEERWLGSESQLPELLRADLIDLSQITRFLLHEIQTLESSYKRECDKLRAQLELVSKLAGQRCLCEADDASRCPVHGPQKTETHS